MITELRKRFANVILCEDVRAEIGNKRSLMGVFSGDVIVGELPAAIRIGLYIEYLTPAPTAPHHLTIKLLQVLASGVEVDMTSIEVDITPKTETNTIVIPQGAGVFETECDFVVSATTGEQTVEILRKKIIKGDVAAPR